MFWIITIAILVVSGLLFRKKWLYMQLIDKQTKAIVGSYASLSSPKTIININAIDRSLLLDIKLKCAAAFFMMNGQLITRLPQNKFEKVSNDLMNRTIYRLLPETLSPNASADNKKDIINMFKKNLEKYLNENIPAISNSKLSTLSELSDDIMSSVEIYNDLYSANIKVNLGEIYNAFDNFLDVTGFCEFGNDITKIA